MNALKLAKICDKVAFETHTDIRIAVAATDIYPVSKVVGIPVYAEHVDPYPLDRHTGSVLPEMIKSAGAKGTLINHSEHQIPIKAIAEAVGMCAKLGLTSVVCASTPEKAEELFKVALKTNPGYPPPALHLGRMLYQQKRYSDAEKYLFRYISSSPFNPEAHRLLRETYSKLGNDSAVNRESRFFLELDSDR